jgi:hypothetical protein
MAIFHLSVCTELFACIFRLQQREFRESLAPLFILQKIVGRSARLLEDGTKCTFGHVAGMVGDGGVTLNCRIEPDFMRTARLAVELKAQFS